MANNPLFKGPLFTEIIRDEPDNDLEGRLAALENAIKSIPDTIDDQWSREWAHSNTRGFQHLIKQEMGRRTA